GVATSRQGSSGVCCPADPHRNLSLIIVSHRRGAVHDSDPNFDRFVRSQPGPETYARPSNPAASSRLMLMSGLSCSRLGLAIIDRVWFMTNRPRLAMFWRIATGRAWSGLVADAMKIDQSLRL